MSLDGKRVLVTGATGFIGGRLIEHLILKERAEVTALVRQFKNASRLARFPVRMVAGDVTDFAAVQEAVAECDLVVHCAVTFAGTPDENYRVTVSGAENVCRAAAGKRLVHLSTFSVYGETPSGELSEQTEKKPQDAYGKSKLDAENVVRDHQSAGLPAVILQPTIVYGPWSFWSTYPHEQMSRGPVTLPAEGGLCNAVYVDDVVQAILLGLKSEAASQGSYLISGQQPVDWKAYYESFAGGGVSPVVIESPIAEIKQRLHEMQEPTGIKRAIDTVRFNPSAHELLLGLPAIGTSLRIAKRLLPGTISKLTSNGNGDRTKKSSQPAPVLPVADHLPLLISRSRVSTAAAQHELGYRSEFDLAKGMRLTNAWFDWVANNG